MATVQNSNFLGRVSNPNPDITFARGGVSSSDDSGCSQMDMGGQDHLESKTEDIQLGDIRFAVPVELFDLETLSDIINIANWNELLSENERFGLCKFLPDMEKEMVPKSLAELLSGKNVHFGSPLVDFFKKLKGGEFEPGVSVYRKSLSSFRKRKYYHMIRQYHDSMINRLHMVKDVLEKHKGCDVEERLRVFNALKSRSDLDNSYILDGHEEKNDVSRIIGDVEPQTVKKHNELGDGKKKIANEVTIASYSYDAHERVKKSKFYDKNWMSSTEAERQYLPTQYPLKSDGTNVSSKKLKMQNEFNGYSNMPGSDSCFYPDQALKGIKEKNVNKRVVEPANMDIGYARGRAIIQKIEEIESDTSDQDEKYEYSDLNGVSPFHQPRTAKSVYTPVNFNENTKNGKKPNILAPKNEAKNTTQFMEPYLKKKVKLNDPSPFQTNYNQAYNNSRMEKVQKMGAARSYIGAINSRIQSPNADSVELYVPLLGYNSMNKKRMAASLMTDASQDNMPGNETKDNELAVQRQKKKYTPIAPTVHNDFLFSVIHLLTAIRKVMINPEVSNGQCITVQEITSRVKLNPGDPHILETQEPLHDLIRGALKIFASKSAPLGAKNWKPLVTYEKSKKSWLWVGPVSSTSVEEETSPEAWGMPYKMLLSLINAYANWLNNSQEALKQLGSLPPPPIPASTLDEKERFKDLKTQKNPTTISESSDEQRAYFRKEEYLRYSLPDRAFSYIAFDGKKSSVAPITRGGGKPASKARDHYMLKLDRPPYVTVRCVVRDAAARLPGSIGTRADVCTLLRDSQYIVEDISTAQLNQVVSGALDRLHSDNDPCIHFDQERKLWVYLHRDRDEEDFEDDGTSSSKNSKKSKKDAAAESSDAGIDLNSDI